MAADPLKANCLRHSSFTPRRQTDQGGRLTVVQKSRMSVLSAVFLTVIVSSCFAQVLSSVTRPNIIIVLADDLGWNDVSFHGSDQIQTPNIDALAYNGIILNSHYVPALCTPSRSSLLTGKYPTSLGMQHLVILAPEPWGLPLNETLMPQHLKRHGYSTHAIGKWHLGFHEKEYTPTYRGFDTHFGYWNGFQDYFDHTMQFQSMKGYDMRRGMAVDLSSKGKYSTDVFTEEAVHIIRQHNTTQGPLFLYLSHLAPHAGNPEEPFKAPEEEMAKHAHIADPERRAYAAMVSKLDESLGKVMASLEEKDMLDNSIILFMTDNGAVTFGLHSNRGSNHPLRGLKESPWEGGVRGVAAIWSPLLKNTRRVSDQLMHMSDWLPTLYSAAGLDTSELGAIDGKDMWNVLSQNLDSPRTEVFNNYDEIDDYSSLMVGSWKYVKGTTQDGEVDGWYGDTGEVADLDYDVSRVLESPTNLAISRYLREAVVGASSGSAGPEPISRETMLELRRGSVIVCEYPTFSSFVSDNQEESCTEGQISKEDKEEIIWELEKIYQKHPAEGNPGGFAFSALERTRLENLIEGGQLSQVFRCDPLQSACLFNLAEDPCERVNLARIFPGVVEILEKRLDELKKEVVRPINQPIDPFSNPALYNDTWTTWCDAKRENDPKMLMKAMVESVSSTLKVDRLLTPLAETFVLKSLRETFSPVAQLLESFLWLAILIITGIMVLYAVAALKRLVPSQGGDSARKKSWTQWENLTFRPFTNPEARNAKAAEGR